MTEAIPEVVVTVNWHDVPRGAIQRFLWSRYARFRWLFCLAPAVGSIIVLYAIKKIARTSEHPFALGFHQGSVLGVLIGMVGFTFASMVVNRMLLRSYWRAITSAPVRSALNQLHIGAKGVRYDGSGGTNSLDWQSIVDVVAHKNVTLIMMSPVEYYPVLDSCLPPGLSPDDLRARIAAWRAAAQPAA